MPARSTEVTHYATSVKRGLKLLTVRDEIRVEERWSWLGLVDGGGVRVVGQALVHRRSGLARQTAAHARLLTVAIARRVARIAGEREAIL